MLHGYRGSTSLPYAGWLWPFRLVLFILFISSTHAPVRAQDPVTIGIAINVAATIISETSPPKSNPVNSIIVGTYKLVEELHNRLDKSEQLLIHIAERIDELPEKFRSELIKYASRDAVDDVIAEIDTIQRLLSDISSASGSRKQRLLEQLRAAALELETRRNKLFKKSDDTVLAVVATYLFESGLHKTRLIEGPSGRDINRVYFNRLDEMRNEDRANSLRSVLVQLQELHLRQEKELSKEVCGSKSTKLANGKCPWYTIAIMQTMLEKGGAYPTLCEASWRRTALCPYEVEAFEREIQLRSTDSDGSVYEVAVTPLATKEVGSGDYIKVCGLNVGRYGQRACIVRGQELVYAQNKFKSHHDAKVREQGKLEEELKVFNARARVIGELNELDKLIALTQTSIIMDGDLTGLVLQDLFSGSANLATQLASLESVEASFKTDQYVNAINFAKKNATDVRRQVAQDVDNAFKAAAKEQSDWRQNALMFLRLAAMANQVVEIRQGMIAAAAAEKKAKAALSANERADASRKAKEIRLRKQKDMASAVKQFTQDFMPKSEAAKRIDASIKACENAEPVATEVLTKCEVGLSESFAILNRMDGANRLNADEKTGGPIEKVAKDGWDYIASSAKKSPWLYGLTLLLEPINTGDTGRGAYNDAADPYNAKWRDETRVKIQKLAQPYLRKRLDQLQEK